MQKSEFERLRRKPTENLSAYDLYLRGLSKLYLFKNDSLQEAIKLFQDSMALDPQFVSPCAAEAFAIGGRQTFGWGEAAPEERTRVNTLARRAGELDKDDAIALTYAVRIGSRVP